MKKEVFFIIICLILDCFLWGCRGQRQVNTATSQQQTSEIGVEAPRLERARAVYWLLIAYGVNESRLLPMQGGVTTQFGDNSPLNRMVVVCPGLL